MAIVVCNSGTTGIVLICLLVPLFYASCLGQAKPLQLVGRRL